jgi:hypothetical protein
MGEKIVKRDAIEWGVIQTMLGQEGIKLTVKKENTYYTENSSGMGKIAGLNYTFLLSELGTAILTVTIPSNEKQRKAIKRFVGLISKAESVRLARFPVLENIIPGIESASKLNRSLRETQADPAPNLCLEIPEVRTILIQWGCTNIASQEELGKRFFPMTRVIEL